METRITKLEEFADEVRGRLARIEAQLAVINVRLDGMATKAELVAVNARIDVLSEHMEKAVEKARNKTIIWTIASFGVLQLLSNLSLRFS